MIILKLIVKLLCIIQLPFPSFSFLVLSAAVFLKIQHTQVTFVFFLSPLHYFHLYNFIQSECFNLLQALLPSGCQNALN